MATRDTKHTLSGLVKVDESFFGPKSAGKSGRGTKSKEVVIITVSTIKDKDGKERSGFVHAVIVTNAEAGTIENILRCLEISNKEIEPLIISTRTDGWRSYQTVAEELEVIHFRAVLRNPKDSIKLLPWIHQIIVNAKAVLAEPHRSVSRKHIKRYLSEVCYRFNRRFWQREAFDRLLAACTLKATITHDELMDLSLGELTQ